MILEARDVTFYYRGRRHTPVLENFSISVSSGERVGLKAPSGRGKTTLCRLLAGYEKPAKGQVLLDGRPVREYRGVCPVQMVWQHPETVVDPLLTLGKTLNEAGAVEQRLLDALHIEPGWLTRYPSELSGGELQRFCLARALNPEVRFLLCDEISAMLDLVTQAQIWKFLLEEAQRRGLGMLVVSHDEALLEKVCTRVETMPWQI
ncbi:MAG: ATP-binding cassette domain-containing protein [Mediterraneibacter sp.]|nr:ATP-binding cassette domain-containing protein [Candidatus Mediterraneibacter caccogallinarum]